MVVFKRTCSREGVTASTSKRELLGCWFGCLLGGGVLGDGLGALTDSMLGQLTGEKETHGGLDFTRGDGAPLVVVGQTASLGGDALKDIVNERIHDGHGLGGDTGVWVHLLQHLVDVDAVAFLPLALSLLVAGANGLGLAGLLGTFG